MTVLLTGGTGYIGSHTAVELLAGGHRVVIVDNLSNSQSSIVPRIEKVAGRSLVFYKADVADKTAMEKIFSENQIQAVIHFAGFKAVKESVDRPLMYYRNNLDSTLTLLEVMAQFQVRQLVFSSSATVYGTPERLPITEDMSTSAINPYGQTKLMIERILQDTVVAKPGWSFMILRYFNPVGAHPSGLLGEAPNGIPNNLMPYVMKVVAGELERLHIFGGDYPTPDGTGVRDYIHVVDLAKGHSAALDYCMCHPGCHIFNLGTGKPSSVLDVVAAVEAASGRRVPYVIEARRPGDVAACYAGTEKANRLLGWQAEKTLQDMCNDAWRWQQSGNCGAAE